MKQPNPLRIAEQLEACGTLLQKEAATELRLLYEANQELIRVSKLAHDALGEIKWCIDSEWKSVHAGDMLKILKEAIAKGDMK